ncbi:hypothetical protein HanPSC8_Chr12g0523631 [Helianthus annuus]|nr:hypothetical protein HanPSC8_Chr12g0523631 [Helianthus annuus]
MKPIIHNQNRPISTITCSVYCFTCEDSQSNGPKPTNNRTNRQTHKQEHHKHNPSRLRMLKWHGFRSHHHQTASQVAVSEPQQTSHNGYRNLGPKKHRTM